MRYFPLIALAGAALALAGCSQQQQAEANSKAQQAKTQLQQGAQHANQRLKQGTANLNKEMTDQEIDLKVKTAMTASDKLNTSGIKVFVKNKVITLVGAVADSNQKALAERITKDTVGKDVKVVSKLQVKPPTGGKVSK